MQTKDGVDRDVKLQIIESRSDIIIIYDSTYSLLVMLFVHNIVSQYLSTISFAHINPAYFYYNLIHKCM